MMAWHCAELRFSLHHIREKDSELPTQSVFVVVAGVCDLVDVRLPRKLVFYINKKTLCGGN